MDCGDRAMCVPLGSGNSGTCQCDTFFGFRGRECRDLSATSFLQISLAIINIVHTLWVMNVSMKRTWPHQAKISGGRSIRLFEPFPNLSFYRRGYSTNNIGRMLATNLPLSICIVADVNASTRKLSLSCEIR